ncbi:hypothetical protein [Sphingobium fuliginis]|uniref:hypothetical protein n=1 Tax=Sphingobium fuliginis (strain ATCC 27551) TaxID=336203 RepID=UPI0003FE8965|nr:hypothetical protein [Sphingobium fuliginis]
MTVSQSRRALLRGMTIAPFTASAITSPWAKALAPLHQRYEDEPATIARTKEGRSISRFRYHNAERRWSLAEVVPFHESRFSNPALHYAGFVCQQALCAYLLDVALPMNGTPSTSSRISPRRCLRQCVRLRP